MYLGHLWEETDGKRQSQAKSSETHQRVDGQDQPPLSLQEGEPEGTDGTLYYNYISMLKQHFEFLYC